jgi:hypothetical protein
MEIKHIFSYSLSRTMLAVAVYTLKNLQLLGEVDGEIYNHI